jgi:hypothetical protein
MRCDIYYAQYLGPVRVFVFCFTIMRCDIYYAQYLGAVRVFVFVTFFPQIWYPCGL